MFHNEWKLCPEVLEIRYVLKCISNSQMVGLICPPILIDELNASYRRECILLHSFALILSTSPVTSNFKLSHKVFKLGGSWDADHTKSE